MQGRCEKLYSRKATQLGVAEKGSLISELNPA